MEIKLFRINHLFITNQCYLVYEHNTGILVDPAWDYKLINGFLVDHNIILKAVLLTHAHPDHTNLAQQFAKTYNVPVFISAIEMDTYGFDCLHLKSVSHLQKIQIERFSITPMLTPGHTAGSICYLIDHHLFSGDTIFIEGVGICIDANKMYDSVQFLKHYLPCDTIFWPGHSFGEAPGKTLAYLLKNNIYFQFENRKHFVDFRTRKNQPDPFAFS